MTVKGCLSEYSLPELLHLLEVGGYTGQLRLQSKNGANEGKEQNYYIWFRQGRIISAFNHLRAHDLIQLIHQRNFLSLEATKTLLRRSPVEVPFGLFLKEKGILTAEQLQLLFSIQVIRQVRSLLTLEDAWFRFWNDSELPYSEMTGISIQATEAILPGLRALKSWAALEKHLPDVLSGLSRRVSQLTLRLKFTEEQVWNWADGETSLQTIAKKMERSLPEVRQIAFCLINAGLVDEIPLVAFAPTADSLSLIPPELDTTATNSTTSVSKGFLGSLEDYFKNLS